MLPGLILLVARSCTLIGLLWLIADSGAGAQQLAREASELLQDLERYEQKLEEYESEFGFFDIRLREPLLAIEALHAKLGNYPEVRTTQNRRLQLTRAALGLEHPDIIPLVEAMVRTDIRLSNWIEVSDHLEHLRTLAIANYGIDSEQAMLALQRQASWYEVRVYVDENRERADNFMEARDIYEKLLDLAEDKYGEGDPRLVPWLNRRAYSLYQQVAGLNVDSPVAMDMIQETVRKDGPARLETSRMRGFINPISPGGINRVIPVTEKGEPVGVAYLRLANGFINDIEDIAEALGDAEMAAMAQLYHGDYAYLQGRSIGRSDYREAREKLLALGIEPERLDAFFGRPMIIPIPIFYSSFSDLEAYQRSGSELPLVGEVDVAEDADPWETPIHLGQFRAWEQGLASIPLPQPVDGLLEFQTPLYSVDVRFRINSRGNISGVKGLGIEPEDRRARSQAVRAVRNLQFRPALYGNRAKPRDHVELRYQIVNESD
ncbi:MAG: hypothetical protein CMQ14_01810 [Gammaproteobacteria bacterium]|nr:hypothetical protein [Gammaproteobacteria bacterium]